MQPENYSNLKLETLFCKSLHIFWHILYIDYRLPTIITDLHTAFTSLLIEILPLTYKFETWKRFTSSTQ